MKIKVLAITVLLCCLHTIYVFGTPKEDYKVLKKEQNRTVIEVFRDCEIIIADIAPKGKDTIYGDCVNDVIYGGENDLLFKDNQVSPNKDENGIKICRNQNKRVVLSVIYEDLEGAEIEIATARDSVLADTCAGFYPGNSFKILVKKNRMQENAFDKELHGILLLFIVLLVGLFWGFLVLRQNRKVLKELSKLSAEFSDLKNVVNSLETKNKIQVDTPLITQQKDVERNSMTDEDIKRFIVAQIKNSQTQFSPSTLQTTVAANSNVDLIANPVKNEELVTDTDNVKFHLEDNSFTLEQTDQKIFRIYSKGGEFYYTIVNDSAVREEFSCMIQTFGGFLNYLSTGGEATSIEVVNDGKLRKDGNKFYVDVNHKLVLKFV